MANDKLYLTQETTYQMYSILNEVEEYLKDNHLNPELRDKLSDMLNEVDREQQSFSYLQS